MNLIYPTENIPKYLPEIIDAYIDYYGIEHKAVIEARFNNMIFLSYSDPSVLKSYYQENKSKENLDYIKEYVDLCSAENKDIMLEQNKEILKNENIVNKEELERTINRYIGYRKFNGFAFPVILNMNNTLMLTPLVYLLNPCLNFNYIDKTLLHEINHCVDFVYEIEGNKLVVRTGLEHKNYDLYEENGRIKAKYCAYNDDDIHKLPMDEWQFTEWLDDRVAYEMYLRLKRKNINILDDSKDIEMTKRDMGGIYTDRLEAFFKKHEGAIKFSRLYNNPNILFNEMGVSDMMDLKKHLYSDYGIESLFDGDQIKNFKASQK